MNKNRETFVLAAPCHFGLEAPLKREIENLGYDVTRTEDGRVTFVCDEEGIALSNIFLRTPERILIQAGEFHAETFDELFEGIRALPWERFIPANGRFWVKKAASVRSKLFSPSDIQSIVKKAVVERLKGVYNLEWFPEDGANYPIRIFIHKDRVLACLDTSGESLHKRGYRALASAAPISETLAAALIMLMPWKGERILVDPFCGSGTFAIEAAMMAADIAPGMNRTFLAQGWEQVISPVTWKEAFAEARDRVRGGVKTNIRGYDIDPGVISVARHNAALAGVGDLIHFQQRDVAELSHSKKYGFIITNPPYGERLSDDAGLAALYKTLGERYRALDSWSLGMITSYADAQKCFGARATKNRKIYNGMIKTYFYQYMGPKPPSK